MKPNKEMKKAKFLFGLPCSGKTTYYKETLENTEHTYINADDLKEEFDDYDETVVGMYSTEAITMAKAVALRALQNGENIIMDAGAINNSYTMSLLEAAKGLGYLTEVIHIDTPYDICIERNKIRSRKVPEKIITEKEFKRSYHWAKYMKSNLVDITTTVPYFTEKHMFFDMDGVLAAQTGLPVVNGKIDFVNSNYFRHLPVVPQVHKIVESLLERDDTEVYILSAAPTSISAREKYSWLRENYPKIKEENIFFVNSGRYKAEMFSDLATKLKLKKSDMCLVEDTHEIIKTVRREYNMCTLHISEFLTKYYR